MFLVEASEMDEWVLKQLRAQVISDLKNHISTGYFSQNLESMAFSDAFKNHEYLSIENKWGYLAAKVGKKIYFDQSENLLPRELAACDVLMNLGFLASSKACLNVCEQIEQKAIENGVSDGNSGKVANQFKNQHIPTYHMNIKGALEQYLQHLSEEEAKPYLSLLSEVSRHRTHKPQITEDILEIKPNFMGIGLNLNALLRRARRKT
ncbi:hypothetical protein B9J80_14005 [Vibrio sp. V12_P9A6T4]|jgi:hypothetical protein|nr:hypothetical protein B9J80_14005 [Vibrio sp. V12_P9A6T4]